MHDFLTVGAAAPLQEAGALALALPDSYYTALAEGYRRRRDRLLPILEQRRLPGAPARGRLLRDDRDRRRSAGTTTWRSRATWWRRSGSPWCPGSSFYKDPADGRGQVRFAFCKKDATLDEAERRLARLRSAAPAR